MASTSIRARSLAAAISISLVTAGLHAATITVDSADDDPDTTACNLRKALKAVNDGSTLAAPTCSAAVSGDPFGTNDTIVLAGLYYPITLTQGALTVTASSVTISAEGSVPPSGVAPRAAGYYQGYQLIDAAGGSRVFTVGDDAMLSASGLALTGAQTAENGGGIAIGIGATLMLDNCSIYGNITTGNGGAIYAAPSSTLTLTNSTVSGNSALAGGALFANDSVVTVTNTSIAHNDATSHSGGIYAVLGGLALDTAVVLGNTAQVSSGGVVVANATLTMANSRVVGNSGGSGGGLFLSGATGTIATSEIQGNSAVCGFACGGAMFLDHSVLAVSGSTISGNLAAGVATYVTGGVNVYGSTATFANSTISGNVGAGSDGTSGAFSQVHWGANTSLTLVNSTVTHNTAVALYGAAFGGVVFDAYHFSPPIPGYDTFTAQNTIISGNVPAGTDIGFGFGGSPTVEYSLLGSAQNISAFNDPANHNIFSDSPGLGPLQDNGGPTRTHALLPDSPALSAGSNALAAFSGQPLSFDQRGTGFARISGGRVDIGAYEDQTDQLFADGFESEP